MHLKNKIKQFVITLKDKVYVSYHCQRFPPFFQSLHSSQGNCKVYRWSKSILLQRLLKPTKFASGAAKVLQHSCKIGAPRSDGEAHWDKQLPFSLGVTYPTHEVHVSKGLFLTPFLQGYWQNIGTSWPVRLNTFQRDSWRTFTPCYQCLTNFSFIRLHLFFSFYLKGNTKIWLCTGGRRRRASRVSQFSFWEFFFLSPTVSKSSQSSCCQLCSHPQNGTSQLEWTKVHRWVGEGRVWVLVRVEERRHRPLASLQGLCSPALHLKRKKEKKIKTEKAQLSCLHSIGWSSLRIQDHTHTRTHTHAHARNTVHFEDLVYVLVTPPTLPQPNTTHCPYGRSALANPTRLNVGTNQKEKKNKKYKI